MKMDKQDKIMFAMLWFCTGMLSLQLLIIVSAA